MVLNNLKCIGMTACLVNLAYDLAMLPIDLMLYQRVLGFTRVLVLTNRNNAYIPVSSMGTYKIEIGYKSYCMHVQYVYRL